MALNLDKATRDEIYAEAANLEIPGRSKMTKPQLIEAITQKRLDANTKRDKTPVQPTNEELRTVGADPFKAPPLDLAKALSREIMGGKETITLRNLTKKMRAQRSRFYGMGGRGMGAKHYTTGGVPGHRTIWPPAPVRNAIVGRGLAGAR